MANEEREIKRLMIRGAVQGMVSGSESSARLWASVSKGGCAIAVTVPSSRCSPARRRRWPL
jgi:hypothetical protein